MNDKVNFLKFFFESGKYADEPTVTEKITDFFPGLIYIYDVESKKLKYVNQKFTEYFGFPLENFNNSDDVMANLIFNEDLDFVKQELDKFHSLQDNASYCFNCRFNHSQDNSRYFKTTGSILRRDPSGAPSVLLFIAQDITDQLKSQEETQAIHQLFNETEELLQFGSWSWNVKADTVTWTKGLYQILGFSEEDLIGKISNAFYMQLILPEYRKGVQKAVDHSIRDKTDFSIEYAIQTKQGEVKTVSTTGKVVVGRDGSVQKVLGITRDVTALRNFEKDQERSLRELNRSNKELEEFAYVASHDLQEPLRKIAMFSERLLSKYGEVIDQEGHLFLDRMLVSVGNMRTLIDNLLEFSRANRSSQAFVNLNLKSVFNQVIANLELKIEETKTTIHFESQLPTIEAVATEMEQLFGNLLSNAIKFRKDSVLPEVTIKNHVATVEEKEQFALQLKRTYYVIEVSDNGIGFEEEYAERIFQIFQRLHGKAEYPGSGIGLAICKRIVDNHNGIIYAQSKPGKGATFTVILPEKQF
jgi:PAS domain S-box-containing protein